MRKHCEGRTLSHKAEGRFRRRIGYDGEQQAAAKTSTFGAAVEVSSQVGVYFRFCFHPSQQGRSGLLDIPHLHTSARCQRCMGKGHPEPVLTERATQG